MINKKISLLISAIILLNNLQSYSKEGKEDYRELSKRLVLPRNFKNLSDEKQVKFLINATKNNIECQECIKDAQGLIHLDLIMALGWTRTESEAQKKLLNHAIECIKNKYNKSLYARIVNLF